MKLLADNCPVCWTFSGALHRCDRSSASNSTSSTISHRLYVDCTHGSSSMAINSNSWLDLKKKIRFQKKNQFCYACHLPLGPHMACHANVKCDRFCPFSNILVHILWVIRNSRFWGEAASQFRLPQNMSVEGYANWLVQEVGGDFFHNGLEACHWFLNAYRQDTLKSSAFQDL